MIYVLLFFWLACALLVIHERIITRLIIYFAIFSTITSLCFLLVAAPDVAIAEAVVSTLATIIFIVSFEKYDDVIKTNRNKKQPSRIMEYGFPALFCFTLFVLFLKFIPDLTANPYLKDQYISMFSDDVGGENAVTAIYLGYRVYDTLFEALMLFISIVAVIHLSQYQDTIVLSGKRRDSNRSDIAAFTIRIICPLMVFFGIYLIMNGHISPGGGFQGGVVVASFFLCRYMIHSIYDIPIKNVIVFKKIIYVGIILFAAFFVFLSANVYLSIPKDLYLILMNVFIGLKVACGFLILFYRFIAFEWR